MYIYIYIYIYALSFHALTCAALIVSDTGGRDKGTGGGMEEKATGSS